MRSRPGSNAPPLCIFHAQDEESLAKRANLRRLGSRRVPLLAPLNVIPDLRVETDEDLRKFQKAILELLLRREVEPATARAAVDIATLIHGEQAKQSDADKFEVFAKSFGERFARELSLRREESIAQETTG